MNYIKNIRAEMARCDKTIKGLAQDIEISAMHLAIN